MSSPMSLPTPGAPGSHGGAVPGPPPTLLPDDGPEATAAALLRDEVDPADVAAAHPAASLAWSVLATRAYAAGQVVEAYAYARTGYHRGLDALRKAGWRGAGPVPWHHEPNRGFLRSLAVLGRAAAAIGEDDEAERCTQFLSACDPDAADRLAGDLTPGAP
ncbi:DUF3151 domain-containing protein [Quadrisphaera setariae]|nr:DUF3151 domain-containing protein [Quadrisphaera setariae]